MASPSKEQLRSQIRCLKNCETHFQEHGRLLEARTRLEEEIARLQKGDPEGLLPACRKKLADVDHRLDDLEESVEIPPDELRLNILAALEELYPDELEEIAESKGEYIQRLDLQKRLKRTLESLNLIAAHAYAVLEARQRVKRRGVLSYILGTSPNVRINLALGALQKLLPEETSEAEAVAAHAQITPTLQGHLSELSGELKTLHALASSRWSFKTVDNEIAPLVSKLESLRIQIEKESAALKAMIGAQEAHLDRWIGTFS